MAVLQAFNAKGYQFELNVQCLPVYWSQRSQPYTLRFHNVLQSGTTHIPKSLILTFV